MKISLFNGPNSMKAIAKLWTFLGNWYIPLGVGWAVYVRGGLTDKPAEAVLVSRAYWGLVCSLLVASGLVWCFSLYRREATYVRSDIPIPPNTSFEDTERYKAISVATVIVYSFCVISLGALFASSYSDSTIHHWDPDSPVAEGFFASRLEAHKLGCDKTVCYAMGSRKKNEVEISGVNEYLRFLNDGILLILALTTVVGLASIIWPRLKSEKHTDAHSVGDGKLQDG